MAIELTARVKLAHPFCTTWEIEVPGPDGAAPKVYEAITYPDSDMFVLRSPRGEPGKRPAPDPDAERLLPLIRAAIKKAQAIMPAPHFTDAQNKQAASLELAARLAESGDNPGQPT